MSNKLEKEWNLFKYNGEPVRFRLGTIVLMVLCVLLIIIATFTELKFKHFYIPLDLFSKWNIYFNDGFNIDCFIKSVKYIPQVPIIFFILGLLDRKFTLITIILYIILGFSGYPIFAMGGGWRYIFQYGVGYILSYIPAVYFSGTILDRNYTLKNIFRSVVAGVIIINIIGALVLLLSACLRHDNWFMVKNLLYSMSVFKFFYDIVFSIIAVYLALFMKKLLWIVMN